MKNKLSGTLALLFATVIWGSAFIAQSVGMDHIGPMTFQASRCGLGALFLIPIIFLFEKDKKQYFKNWADAKLWKTGFFCGTALFVAAGLQQVGLVYTSAGKAGFITTLYIIFVPIAGIFFRRRVGGMVWLAAALAAVGMYLLCMTESFALSSGDTLVFLCAVVFTAHIMVIDHYADHVDGVIVSCIQFTIAGLVCTVGALLFEEPTFAALGDGIIALLYAGVMSCGIAYTLQIVGQKGVNPTVAALILSLESVVATVAGVVAFKIGLLKTDQTMTGRQIAGCVLVFVGVILVQLPWDKWFVRKVNNE